MDPPSASCRADYGPPASQHSLFQLYCDECPVAPICGELRAESACDDPAAYSPDALHPARHKVPLSEFALPQPRPDWGSLDTERSTIVICSDPNPPLAHFGVDLRTALQRVGPYANNQVVAFLLGRDEDLEHVWDRRGALGQILAKKGYRAVVAPAYSTWHDESPYAGLAAVARSAAVADAFASRLTTVPTVVWRTATDICRQVEWLCPGTPTVVAVDVAARNSDHWLWLLEGIVILSSEFQQALGGVPHLVAHGPSTVTHIADVRDCWPGRITVASQMPAQVARSGSRLTPDFDREFDASETREDLLVANAATFDLEVQRILARQAGDSLAVPA